MVQIFHSAKPLNWGRPIRQGRSRPLLLLVDGEAARAKLLCHLLDWHGFGAPETAANADDALDGIGAARQRYDAVLMALPLIDEGEIDITGILRQHRSPVRIARYTSLEPHEARRATGLAGTAAVIDLLDPTGVVRHTDAVLRSAATVGRIIDQRIVPETLTAGWARAIYGALPGRRFNLSHG